MIDRNLSVFIIIIFLLSCSKQKNSDHHDDVFNTKSLAEILDMATPMNGKIIERDYILGNPFWLASMDSLLISMEMSGDYTFHIYDIKNDREIGKYKNFGRGPGEFISPFSLDKIDHHSIGVYDINGSAYFQVSIDSLINHDHYYPRKIFDLSAQKKRLLAFLPIDQHCFVALGTFDNGKYAFYIDNELQSYSYHYPEDGHDNIGDALKATVYQGKLRKNPDQDKFVYVNSSSPVFEILEKSEDALKLVYKKIFGVPDYVLSKNGHPTKKRENLMGFVSSAVGHKYIYLLYSGRSYAEKGMDAYLGNQILVIDWNGNYVNSYLSDYDLKVIAISDDEEKLYAIVNDPEPKYIVYQF